MSFLLFSSASTDQTAVPAGGLPAAVAAYRNDLQTGVIEVSLRQRTGYHLLFSRGQLVNVYQHGRHAKRLDPTGWLQSFNGSSPAASLRALALTPQAIRLVKILFEQEKVSHSALPEGISLEKQVETWTDHPVPALAHVCWSNAEALALLPGEGKAPHYTLFVSSDQILHSAGGMMALYGWKEPCTSVGLLSSEANTPAWAEYLLHYSFSWMVTHLLERFHDLTGPMLLNSIVRDINFTAAAHGWNISIVDSNVTDQSIFTSPEEAAEVYTRLFEIIFNHVKSLIGPDLLTILLRESAMRMSKPCRTVLQEYLLITPT